MKKFGIFLLIVVSLLVLITGGVLFISKSKQETKTTGLSDKKIYNKTTMKITSSAFENNAAIPQKYACNGESINPPLAFSDIPNNAESLVLIMDDPDAPNSTFVHWVIYNIDPKEKGINENSVPAGSKQGKTSAEKEGYIGPCPPSGTHRYFFKLYALDSTSNLDNPDKSSVEKAMEGHIIAQAELMGTYKK